MANDRFGGHVRDTVKLAISSSIVWLPSMTFSFTVSNRFGAVCDSFANNHVFGVANWTDMPLSNIYQILSYQVDYRKLAKFQTSEI